MASSPITLVPVRDKTEDVVAVASTVTTSFSPDPLITWLRPNATPWREDQPSTMKWQCRRIRRSIYDGLVFSADLSTEIDQVRPQTLADDKSQRVRHAAESVHVGAAVVLVPPRRPWTLSRVFLGAKLWFLDRFYPVVEEATDINRLEQLMKVHDEALQRIKDGYKLRRMWYLEIVALHPSLQNRGLGRRVMESVVEFVGDEPIALECTAEENVRFYEKLGFATSEVAELSDEKGSVRLWFMVRLPASCRPAN